MKCAHEKTHRGKDIPLRWGSHRSEVCECGMFRRVDHHGRPHGDWRPASEYADATAPREEDE